MPSPMPAIAPPSPTWKERKTFASSRAIFAIAPSSTHYLRKKPSTPWHILRLNPTSIAPFSVPMPSLKPTSSARLPSSKPFANTIRTYSKPTRKVCFSTFPPTKSTVASALTIPPSAKPPPTPLTVPIPPRKLGAITWRGPISIPTAFPPLLPIARIITVPTTSPKNSFP